MYATRTVTVTQALFLIFLLYITARILNGADYWLLHNVNLIFHEAGHVIFGFFGDFIQFLGGTLGQLLIPLICLFAFLFRNDIYAAAIMLWWFGENLIDVSIYIADARTRALPLIGGEHDWYYLLAVMNVLEKDTAIGSVVFYSGALVMLSSLGIGFFFLYHRARTKKRDYES